MRLLAASKSFAREFARSSHSGRYQGSGVITEKVNTIIPSFVAFSVLQEFSLSRHHPTPSTKMESVSE